MRLVSLAKIDGSCLLIVVRLAQCSVFNLYGWHCCCCEHCFLFPFNDSLAAVIHFQN